MKEKIYFLPGTMCNKHLWDLLIPYLSNQYELVFLDIPKHKSLKNIVAHYVHLLSDQAINVVGFSLGGYIASYIAVHAPERVCRLFVIANSPTRLPHHEIQQRKDILSQVSKYGYSGMGRKKAASLLDDKNRSVDFVSRILTMEKDVGYDALSSQYMHTTDRIFLIPSLEQRRGPTFFYFSVADPLVNADALYALSKRNSHISIFTEDGNGHMLPFEKPKTLANHINQWMAQLIWR